MTTPLGQVTGELRDVREWVTYGAAVSNPIASNTKARTGSYAVRFGSGEKSAGIVIAAQNSLRTGYWLNHNGRNSALTACQPTLFALRTAGSSTVKVIWASAGILSLRLNDVEVATCSDAVMGLADTWQHIALTYTTERCILWINGLVVLDYTGSLLSGITGVYAGGVNNPGGGTTGFGNYAYIDDFYIDGDIANVAEMPPPERFVWSAPTTAGAAAQWTPTGAATNVECVDDAVPDDDATYVLAAGAALLDLYATSDITLPTDYGIVSVIPIALAKRMAPGPTLKLVAADGVNANLESAEKTPGTSYGYVWSSMPLAPDGGAWTEAKLNAAQFGVKSSGVFA